MNLVIVESPTKARKLSEYLGHDFVVQASVGHVRDLPKNKLGIDLENNFEPTYEVADDKKAVVKTLTDLAQKADQIYLATDPDREGEAIAWHIYELLKNGKKKLEDSKFHRSTFHEITKTAVLEAINTPAQISFELVNAQQARRVVDRLVGYQVSPVLWKKIRRGLSAGRVQSVALRLIAEREREIASFIAEEYWEVDVLLNTDLNTALKLVLKDILTSKEPVNAQLLIARVTEVSNKKYEPTTADHVNPVLTDLQTAAYQVDYVEQKSRERASLPPFTTSTLQQAAANRLGFTSKQTMSLAQQLYEEGLITYHRTDSVNLSSGSLEMAREYIGSHFGASYVPAKARYFAQKSKNAQEAHEAVRVTEAHLTPEQMTQKHPRFEGRHAKLYDLIWRRFLASQMCSAVYDQTAITIDATAQNATHYTLRTSGSVLRFDGWMKLFSSQEDVILPAVTKDQKLEFVDLNSAQKFTQPPARYNDASLVKELEKRGIGRPSTYASIISVIVDRGYVERLEKRFTATAVGLTVSDFLVTNFTTFMDYDFTAEMEEDLDRIARGEKEWHKVVSDFYAPLAKTINQVIEKAERVSIPVEETGETCPLCGDKEGGKIVIRTGKFGKFKSCNRFPECKFTENLVEKIDGMNCPLCNEGEVIVKKTRWGKPFYGCLRYPTCDWASWQKPDPTLKVTAAEWEIMKAEREERKKNRPAKPSYARKPVKAVKPKAKTATKTKKTKPAAKPKSPTKKVAKA